MKVERGPIPIHFARELVEEALMAASNEANADVRRAFREEREAVQSIETVDIREKRQDALDSHWMERLQVAEPLQSILARHPDVENLVSSCSLRLARAKEDEEAFLSLDGSPLVESADGKRALVVQLTVDTLLAKEKLEPLLMSTLAKAHQHAKLSFAWRRARPPKPGG